LLCRHHGCELEVVSTRVLTPLRAVAWAAFRNFIAAFAFGTAVAKTMGKGMVRIETVNEKVLLAGLLGAIIWNLITLILGLPTSSSHALMGGYGGAAVAHVGFKALILGGWTMPVLFIFLSGFVGCSWCLRPATVSATTRMMHKREWVSLLRHLYRAA
jgi:PiT family inorganic phosphate transporter